jgi:catechol 2,3-dioxygenase-like lactoylglutathione lyase family enzyme
MLRSRALIPTLASVALALSQSMPSPASDAPSSFEPGPLRGHSFAQIAIQVTDLDRATAFYRDVLGLPLLFVANGMVFFQVGEARLMVERGKPAQSTTLYFDDSELKRSRVLLERHGVKFAGPIETVQRTESYELKLLEFSDPDGNPLALMGKVPRWGARSYCHTLCRQARDRIRDR